MGDNNLFPPAASDFQFVFPLCGVFAAPLCSRVPETEPLSLWLCLPRLMVINETRCLGGSDELQLYCLVWEDEATYQTVAWCSKVDVSLIKHVDSPTSYHGWQCNDHSELGHELFVLSLYPALFGAC